MRSLNMITIQNEFDQYFKLYFENNFKVMIHFIKKKINN